MAVSYKYFLPLRIVFCTVFAIFFLFCVWGVALAADPVFTVENVAVDVTADNAIMAREQAFEQGQVKAFEILATRMLDDTERATLPVPDSLVISSLIQDFEIVSEKLSAVRYIGTYTFRFKDHAVRKHFARSGTVYSDVSSTVMLVLPFLEQGNGQTVLWSPYNDWMRAWRQAPQTAGLVPLRLPLGDLDDVRDIGDNQALRYTESALKSMLRRYGAKEAVIAIASPDVALSRIQGENQIAQGRLSVEIYRTDRARPEPVQQISIPANGAQTKAQLYHTAVARVHRALQKDWKSKTIVTPQSAAVLEVFIPIRSLQEWVNIQSDLKRVNGIDAANLKKLSPQNAVVDLMYQGDEQRLSLALRQAGMRLEQSTDAMGQVVYMLNTSRFAPPRGPSRVDPYNRRL